MKINFPLPAAALALMLITCNVSDQANEIPAGMHMVSLRNFGKPIKLHVPDTNASRLMVEEMPDGGLTIESGRSFRIVVYEQAADLKLKKSDITSDEVNRLGRITLQNEDALIWESAITTAEHHFVLNRTIGGREYCFSDAGTGPFTEPNIKTMFECALSARAE